MFAAYLSWANDDRQKRTNKGVKRALKDI